MSAWLDPATRRTFAAPGGSEGVAAEGVEARGFLAEARGTSGGYDPPLQLAAYVAGCLLAVMGVGFLLGVLVAWLWR